MKKLKSLFLLIAFAFTTSVAFGAYHPPGEKKQTSVVKPESGSELVKVDLKTICQVATQDCDRSVIHQLDRQTVFSESKNIELKQNFWVNGQYKGEAVEAVPNIHCTRIKNYFNLSTIGKDKIYLWNCSIRQC